MLYLFFHLCELEHLPCPRTSCAAWECLVFVRVFCLTMVNLLQHSSSPPPPECERQFRCFQPSIFLNKKILLHQEEYAYSGTWCLFQCIYCQQAHSCSLLFNFVVESCVSAVKFQGDPEFQGNSCCCIAFHLLREKLIISTD